MEPPCRNCTRLAPPAAFNSRTLGSRYKSPVTRRREYCEPGICNAKVGTDLKSEFDSRFYNVDRIVNKIQELKRNVQDFDGSKRHDKTKKVQHEDKLEPSQSTRITDLESTHHAVENCLREMEKVKTFLEDENLWWKILKGRSVNCCQQKLPHLHGVLDGSSVTLMLLEEGTDEAPRHFVTSMPKKRSDVAGTSYGTLRELTNEAKRTEQCTDLWKEHSEEDTESYATPYYSLDMKSALIEVASVERHEPTRRYAERAVTSKQSSVASEFWTEGQEDESDEHKKAEKLLGSKETRDKIQSEDKEKKTIRPNIVPSREIWYGTQTTFEDTLRPRETFSSENTEGKKRVTADFESNVDLNTEHPSRNVASHKPRTKTIIEKGVYHTENLPTKISKTKSKN